MVQLVRHDRLRFAYPVEASSPTLAPVVSSGSNSRRNYESLCSNRCHSRALPDGSFNDACCCHRYGRLTSCLSPRHPIPTGLENKADLMHISRDCREVTGLAKLRMSAFTGRDAGIISFCLGKVRDHSGRSVANASSLLCGSLPRFQGLRLRNRVFHTSGKLCICPPDGHGLLPVKRRCSRLPSLIGSKLKGNEFNYH